MKLLDLFCCAGGAAMGYHQAGFEVVGVDIDPQPNFPFEFIQHDALTMPMSFLRSFDAIHASPPCQGYTKAQRIMKNDHPDLVDPVRRMLEATGLPYILENVPGAPLLPEKTITLCGSMFPELRVYRHRNFETNFPVAAPPHREHHHRQVKMGRPVQEGDFIQVVGNFSGVAYARKAMGISWMLRDELREAIPPAFTRLIGAQLLAQMDETRLRA